MPVIEFAVILRGLPLVVQIVLVLCSFTLSVCTLLIVAFSPCGAERLGSFLGQLGCTPRRRNRYNGRRRVQQPRSRQ